jgi:hypothetical protein
VEIPSHDYSAFQFIDGAVLVGLAFENSLDGNDGFRFGLRDDLNGFVGRYNTSSFFHKSFLPSLLNT